jgi:peptidoglycan/LPS O-acetylase OafA/YrhL
VRVVEEYAGGRLIRLLFWAAALFALVMALLPPEPGTSLIPDKVQHAVAFGVLGLLGSYAYPRLSRVWLVAGLSLFGALIELAQGTSFIHRDCDPMDWLTDTVACLVVVLAVHWWLRGRRTS